MFWGTLIFPPRLWSACSVLYTQRVFRDAKDDNGYLKELPRGFEAVGTVLVVANAIAWVWAIHWVGTVAWPLGVQLYDAVHGVVLEHFPSAGVK
jgi:hypothetical protein